MTRPRAGTRRSIDGPNRRLAEGAQRLANASPPRCSRENRQSDDGGSGQGQGSGCYLRGRTASLSCLAMRAFTTVLAGILIASPVAGLRPMRALRF